MEYDPTEECDFLETVLEKDNTIHVDLPDKINYYTEIYSIMYAFGDVKKPLENSVKLMYNILQIQMAALITNAEDIMKLRNGEKISHEDFLFLMRKNKVLLKRLLQFLSVEDTKACVLYNLRKKGDELSLEKGERVSVCLRYLAFIEKFTGDLTSVLSDKCIVDHIYMKRLKRKDLMANSMTKEEYVHFYEYTLRVSFCQKYSNERFRRWLQQCSRTKVDITPLALSISHFLARETIAMIVDKALEIKSRRYEKSDNFPFEHFNRIENDFKMDESKNISFYPCETFEDSSDNNNHDVKDYPADISIENKFDESSNVTSSYGIQEMNLFSKTSHNIVNYPITTNTKGKNMVIENSVLNSCSNMQKEDVTLIKSHVDQNNFSKVCANNKSDFISSASGCKRKISDFFSVSNKNLNSNEGKSEMYNKFPNTYFAIDDVNSIMTESGNDQVFSNALLHLPDAAKKIHVEPYFSLNFQEREFSICCDGSKTFCIDTSSAPGTNRFNKTADTEDKDLATSCTVEFIEEPDIETFKSEDSDSRFLIHNSEKYTGYSQFSTPQKIDFKVHWFPEEAITPEEIQAAFIYYQHPLPVSYLMKTKMTRFSHLPSRKTNLVCLANPD